MTGLRPSTEGSTAGTADRSAGRAELPARRSAASDPAPPRRHPARGRPKDDHHRGEVPARDPTSRPARLQKKPEDPGARPREEVPTPCAKADIASISRVPDVFSAIRRNATESIAPWLAPPRRSRREEAGAARRPTGDAEEVEAGQNALGRAFRPAPPHEAGREHRGGQSAHEIDEEPRPRHLRARPEVWSHPGNHAATV